MADTKELTEWLTTATFSPDLELQLALNIEYLARGYCPRVSSDSELIELGLLTETPSDTETRLTRAGYLLAEERGLLRPEYRYPPSLRGRASYSEDTARWLKSTPKEALYHMLVCEP